METPDLPLLILQRNMKEHVIYLEPSLNFNITVEFPEELQAACHYLMPQNLKRYKQNLQRTNHLASLLLPFFKNRVRTDCCVLGKISGMGSLLFSTRAARCPTPSPSACQSRHYVRTALSTISLTAVIKQHRKVKDMNLCQKWKGYAQIVIWNHPVTVWQAGLYTALPMYLTGQIPCWGKLAQRPSLQLSNR